MSTAYLDRFLVLVKVGWTPSMHEDLSINVHITYDLLEWTDIVDFKMLLELRRSINSFTDEFRYVGFPVMNTDEMEDTIAMLANPEYEHDNVSQLAKTARALELWIETVLTNLGKLDEESRRICKQLFFRSLHKLAKYDILLAKVAASETATGTTFGDSVESPKRVIMKRNSMFESMSQMMRNGGIKSATLNKKNLGRISHGGGDEDSRTDHEPSETGTIKTSKTARQILNNLQNRLSILHFTAKKGIDRKSELGGANNAPSALEIAEKSSLLRIEVQRGQETHQGVVNYDITLKVVGKKALSGARGKSKNAIEFTVAQRFSAFKKLHDQLIQLSNAVTTNSAGDQVVKSHDFMLNVAVPFPALPMKSYLGFSLNDLELSARTRSLDSWFRAVCVNYRHMSANARALVRAFLKFEMTESKDIYFQDQLAWGTIEQEEVSRPVLLVQRAVLDNVGDDLQDELLETLSAVGGNINQNIASIMKRKSELRGIRDTASQYGETNYGGEQLQNLLWETASLGGASKLPKNKALQSRSIVKNE